MTIAKNNLFRGVHLMIRKKAWSVSVWSPGFNRHVAPANYGATAAWVGSPCQKTKKPKQKRRRVNLRRWLLLRPFRRSQPDYRRLLDLLLPPFFAPPFLPPFFPPLFFFVAIYDFGYVYVSFQYCRYSCFAMRGDRIEAAEYS